MTAFELELVVLVSLPSLSATMLIRRAAWESDSLHALSKPCAMVLRVRGMKAERWSRDDQVRATSEATGTAPRTHCHQQKGTIYSWGLSLRDITRFTMTLGLSESTKGNPSITSPCVVNDP